MQQSSRGIEAIRFDESSVVFTSQGDTHLLVALDEQLFWYYESCSFLPAADELFEQFSPFLESQGFQADKSEVHSSLERMQKLGILPISNG